MSSREKILAAVSANKPAVVELPAIALREEQTSETLISGFVDILHSISGTVIRTASLEIVRNDLSTAIATGNFIVNTIPDLGDIDKEIDSSSTAAFLSDIEIAFIAGTLGVAENGAIWVKESSMKNRLLPFICQHLALVIQEKDIVSTMHEAYQSIKIDEEGFGVFIAGPSKTADIEQSLVIGAHGARSLTVYLLK